MPKKRKGISGERRAGPLPVGNGPAGQNIYPANQENLKQQHRALRASALDIRVMTA